MIRSLLAKCWGLFAVLTITAAVVLTFIRVLLPYISVYQDEIVNWLQQAVDQPLQVKTVMAEWQGIQPRFIFSGIRFLDKHSNETRFALDEASVTIDVVASALSGELRFGGMEVSGVELSVLHREDGRIQIEEFATASPAQAVADDRRFLFAWLFRQSRLVLKDSEIIWHDEQYSGRRLRFVHVNLQLRNDKDRHQFDGSAALPTDLGRRFNFALDITGDVLTAGGWSGQAYVDGSGLQVNQLLKGLPLAGVRIDKGLAEVKLWSQWQDSRLQRLDGEIALFSLLLNRVAVEGDGSGQGGRPVPPEFLDAVSGRFSWQNSPTGWQLGVNNFVLGRWGEFWPQSDYFLRMQQDESGQQTIELMADFLRLEDITALLLMSDSLDMDWRNKLAEIYPSGQLHQSHLTWQVADTPQFDWSTRFEDLSMQSWQRLPALSGLDGRFHANQQHGVVEFNTRSARVDLRPLFRAPLTINEVVGDVVWQHDGRQGWQIETQDLRMANQDLAMRTRLFAEVPESGPVYLDLVSGFAGTPDSVANTSRYLPVGKMPPRAVAWLDRAIVNGTVNGGGIVLRGPLRHFPFDDHSGKFEVRFSVQDGILDYLNNWPRIDEIEAEVIFAGRGMTVNAVSGRTMDAEILSTQVEIPNLKAHPGELSIVGQARSQTQQALQYLAATPLRKKFSGYLDGITAGGWSQLDLVLTMPLPAHEVKVKGDLQLTDSRLDIADGAVDFQQLDGLLTFTNEGLSARAINGRVMGLNARFDIDTQHIQNKTVTVITGQGDATAAELSRLVNLDLLKKATGRTEWQAELTLPAGGSRRVADLHVSSSLKGITTHLPAPLAKKADEVREFNLDMRFPRSVQSPVTFDVDGVMSGMLDIDRTMRFSRGELRFPAGPLSLPDQRGLRLTGLVPSFSFSDWWPLINAVRGQAVVSNQPGINQLDLQLGELEILGQHFTDLKVAAQYKSPYWRAQVDGAQVAGNIQVPVDDSSPLLMDMQRMQLEKAAENDQGELTDPRTLPPLNIKSQQFSMAGIDFGSLDLVASRHLAGLTISDLKLRSKVMEVLARGDWVVADDRHYSSFNITFNSSDLGKALARFGYVDTVSKGESTFDIVARWPGSPVAFALERLDGNMHMRIENGRLLEVDPGAGRIFGLLSLSALPRRLVLDFRDIFQKGFSFDRIKGDFVIKNGVATTNNLQLKGPAARIEAEGRIGLASQDYDQIINIFPDVAAGLPVAGAVASGLGVGAAILLVKELLKPEIEQASQVRYAVKGPWDKPVITRLAIEERGDKNKKKGK